MNVGKFIKKERAYAIIFILVGVLAALSTLIFENSRGIMFGLAIGFTPTGIGMLLVYKYAERKPAMVKNIKLENEERNIFINTKAAQTAFWIIYWYIFISAILSNIVIIQMKIFTIVTLLLMPVVYFIFVYIYHRRY